MILQNRFISLLQNFINLKFNQTLDMYNTNYYPLSHPVVFGPVFPNIRQGEFNFISVENYHPGVENATISKERFYILSLMLKYLQQNEVNLYNACLLFLSLY